MNRLLAALIAVSLFALAACSDPVDPQFRIVNQRATKANLQVQTTGGNTININDVQAGQATAYQSAGAGQITATATIQSETVSPTTTFYAEKDRTYTVLVVTGTTPTLAVVSP